MYNEILQPINNLEQFLILAKNAHGAAASQLIKQATEYPGVFVFGELLECPGIRELENSSDYQKDFKLLQIFAYGTLDDYKANTAALGELSEQQLLKLRLLTMAALASNSAYVTYEVLLEKLNLENDRQLEDLIIEAIYSGVLKGKLNPKEQKLEVEFVIGRDIQQQNISTMISTLKNWCENCEDLMGVLERDIVRANKIRETRVNTEKSVEQEFENMKRSIKQQRESGGRELEPSSSGLMERMSMPSFKGLKSSMKGGPHRMSMRDYR